MTFLYDDEIIKELSKFAQETSDTFVARDLLNKLITNISSEMVDQKSPFGGENSYSIKVSDLQKSPNDFLLYLFENQVKFNNSLIVSQEDVPGRTKTYVIYNGTKFLVTVNADALTGLLDQVAKIAINNKDQYVASLLNSLKSGLVDIIKSDAAKAINIYHEDEINPEESIGKVPSNYFTTGASPSGEADISFKNLNDKLSFNAWLQNNGVMVDGDLEKTYDNLGLILYYLYSMLDKVAKTATTEKALQIGEAGKQKVSSLASAFGVTLKVSNEPSNKQNSSGKESKEVSFTKLLNNLPFVTDVIDAARISAFYTSLLEIDSSSNISSSASRALTALNDARSLTTSNLNRFPLHSSAAVYLLDNTLPYNGNKLDKIRNAHQILAQLQRAVNEARGALEEFRSKHYKKGLTPDDLQLINAQIGSLSGGSSKYQSNMVGLQRVKSDLVNMVEVS